MNKDTIITNFALAVLACALVLFSILSASFACCAVCYCCGARDIDTTVVTPFMQDIATPRVLQYPYGIPVPTYIGGLSAPVFSETSLDKHMMQPKSDTEQIVATV